MSDDLCEAEFWTIIQSGLDPHTVGYGPGWCVAELMEGVYEVVCDSDVTPQMEATVFILKDLGLRLETATKTPALELEDGRVAVCFIKG